MKKCLQNMIVKNKKVILRVDYNVPILNGKILDDSKIKLTLDTIYYLLSENCRIILLSHLGKVRNFNDKKKYSLEPVANHLKALLNKEDVYFSKENYGVEVITRVNSMLPGEILVLENTRFMDVPNKLESNCDAQLSEFWASLGDVFVNDAFGCAHRAHASSYGISKYVPSCIGFLMQKELGMLNLLVLHPIHPFTVIMGGAKIDDKLELMEHLLPKCDYLLCGGGIANSCLKALGFNVGDSLTTDEDKVIKKIQDLLLKYKDKFVLPLDAVVGSTYDPNFAQYKLINKIIDNDVILDIGSKTLQKFSDIIMNSETIFMNGTVGAYENIKFANGTKELLKILKKSDAIVVVGGGDASSSVNNLGYANAFTYTSSGGGATLEYIAKEHLVALDTIGEEEEDVEKLNM